MNIKSYRYSYSVNFEFSLDSVISIIKETNPSIYIIDKNVYPLYQHTLRVSPHNLLLIDANEVNKNIGYVLNKILPLLIEKRITRNSTIIAIGGGITQDLVAFVCSIFMRGVTWFFLPTTLLSQCDSCIGSKSSLNHGEIKNLLGSFYPPKRIYIIPEFLNTLPKIDIISGIGEILKVFCINGNRKDFEHIDRKNFKKPINKEFYHLIISKSLSIKRQIIQKDEFDADIRKLLNFGHCFGHALESAAKFKIPHGVCVIYGILVALIISIKLKLVSNKKDYEVVFSYCISHLLLQRLFINTDFKSIKSFLYKDKKYNSVDGLTFILFEKIGKVKTVNHIKIDLIETAFLKLKDYIYESETIVVE